MQRRVASVVKLELTFVEWCVGLASCCCIDFSAVTIQTHIESMQASSNEVTRLDKDRACMCDEITTGISGAGKSRQVLMSPDSYHLFSLHRDLALRHATAGTAQGHAGARTALTSLILRLFASCSADTEGVRGSLEANTGFGSSFKDKADSNDTL